MSIRTRTTVFGSSLAVLAGSALIAAAPALAKSSVSISVSPHTVGVGQVVGISAAGGDDSFSSYTEVCVEHLGIVAGHQTWVVLRCTAPTPGYAGGERLHMSLRFDRPQHANLRAQLFSTDSRGGHRQARQATGITVVTVH